MERDRDTDLGQDRDRDQNRDQDRNRDRDQDRDQDQEQDRDRNTDLDQDQERDREWNRDQDQEQDQDRGQDRDRERNRDQDRDQDRNRDQDQEQDQERGQDRDRERNRELCPSPERPRFRPGPTRWGICSAGAICHDFALALQTLPRSEHTVAAVAARDLGRAEAFARRFGVPRAYGSYEELARDPDIDVVYVGTVNPAHLPLGLLFLRRGRPVLMEKPMALGAREVARLVGTARDKGVFLMERPPETGAPADVVYVGTVNPAHLPRGLLFYVVYVGTVNPAHLPRGLLFYVVYVGTVNRCVYVVYVGTVNRC
ncbi:trans-1,2-dihydrobenzene-1,2-diol dehydrogenase-like, partial [Onychostruthus taczanowskii]|uniref:trans-1,2-dihydrobenzene-1,2-diol dehydrogenase-like n=1 Tax=Onychostruthus taczanowskii TaxID=356909 RepID=UPI001B803F63